MEKSFPGFPQEGLRFFAGLARNNKREWFQPRKTIFDETIRQPMLELVGHINRSLAQWAPEYVTEPAKAVYRIYRDTRFSNDKTPYKTHLGASFHSRAAAAHTDVGFYFAVSHKEVAIGGGVYMPDTKDLLRIRTHISAHPDEFRKLLANRKLRQLCGDMQGEQLSRLPKGFQPNDPAAAWLRFKQLFFYTLHPPELATKPALEQEILKRFRALTPFLAFLATPLAQTKKIEAADLF